MAGQRALSASINTAISIPYCASVSMADGCCTSGWAACSGSCGVSACARACMLNEVCSMMWALICLMASGTGVSFSMASSRTLSTSRICITSGSDVVTSVSESGTSRSSSLSVRGNFSLSSPSGLVTLSKNRLARALMAI